MSFNRPLYIVTSDHIFNNTLGSRMMRHCFAPIKKRKATTDIPFMMNCMKVVKEGGNILLFAEGNRAWADFQFYIDPAICKMIRSFKIPVILYNLKGGYGVDPRWGGKKRKCKFYGTIKEILTPEQVATMSDDELYNTICDGIKVFDSENGEAYASKKKAEYLERELFVCPVCGSVSTLQSKGNFIKCNACNLSVEYTENLQLKAENKDFKFEKLVDWYKYQLDYIKGYQVKENAVNFSDDDVEIYDKTAQRRKFICKGKMNLTDKALMVGEKKILLSDVTSATVVGGTKLIVNTKENSFFFNGHKRFNSLKYMLMFNKLIDDTQEKYYSLEI